MNWKLLNRVWHANLGMAAVITLGIIALSCPFIAHKGGELALGRALMDIHYGKFLPPETRWIWIDSQGFLLLFLVVSGLLMHRKAVKKAVAQAADDPAVPGSSVTLLDFGSRGLAMAAEGEKRGLRAFRCPAGNLAKLDLSQERWLVVLPGDEGFDLAALATLCGKVKPGSARRLGFAVDGDGEGKVTALLQATGARPMTLSEGPFETAVLDHLAAQSVTLTADKRVQTSPSARALPAAGFTLLEMLLSLLVIAFLVGGAAGALERMSNRDRVRAAAASFHEMLSEAREVARREGAWVRVALLPSGMEQSLLRRGEPEHPRMGATLHVLRRPALEARAVISISTTSNLESAGLQELASVESSEVPDSLRAGWEPAPGHANWTLWDPSVKVSGPVYAAVSADSPWLVKPDTLHPDLAAPLAETPLDAAQVLAVEPFPAADPARQTFGALPVRHWVATGTKGRSVQLPAIDFAPDGRVCGSDGAATVIRFTFRAADGHYGHEHRVEVQPQTGEATLL
ncbi:MAG: hypothetical protein JNJ83_17065 [Verrucomicrobiaceae bacterium]|nr:hypothetical protein [Verrucomicrobiaceae bacterium]